MLDRRQILAALGTSALVALAPTALLAAASIKPDDASALLVIDVQNCFLPGGSLAVKEGEQVVPVINNISKAFATTKTSTRNSRACCVITGWRKRNTPSWTH